MVTKAGKLDDKDMMKALDKVHLKVSSAIQTNLLRQQVKTSAKEKDSKDEADGKDPDEATYRPKRGRKKKNVEDAEQQPKTKQSKPNESQGSKAAASDAVVGPTAVPEPNGDEVPQVAVETAEDDETKSQDAAPEAAPSAPEAAPSAVAAGAGDEAESPEVKPEAKKRVRAKRPQVTADEVQNAWKLKETLAFMKYSLTKIDSNFQKCNCLISTMFNTKCTCNIL